MWWTWHINSIIAYPIMKVLLFLPLVILQAIVYSLLLLFLHPRPEPRTMSLVETVSLCSRAGFLFVSCLTIWSLCYWLWNFNCTLLVFIRRCSSFAVFRTISSTYCGCWLVPGYQQWTPVMITSLLTVLHSQPTPSPGLIIHRVHKTKLVTFFITCTCKPKDFMVMIVSGTVLLPCLKNNRKKKHFLGCQCTAVFILADQNSLHTNFSFYLEQWGLNWFNKFN